MIGQHLLAFIPRQKLEQQGLSHTINLHENESHPGKRIASIQSELSEIKQALFDLEQCKETWQELLGIQRWGTIAHASEELTKGEQVIATLRQIMGHSQESNTRSCQQGTKDLCWTIGGGVPIFRLCRCDCGDLVALFYHAREDTPEVKILLDALRQQYRLERDPVVCPSGRRHIHCMDK